MLSGTWIIIVVVTIVIHPVPVHLQGPPQTIPILLPASRLRSPDIIFNLVVQGVSLQAGGDYLDLLLDHVFQALQD